VLDRMILQPIDFSWECVIPLIAAFVATGMKTGVWTLPFGRVRVSALLWWHVASV
jgi:hypothetical protein